jgi:hypothetical protein
MAEGQNSVDRKNPQTKQGSTFGYPSERGNGSAVINKAPAPKRNGNAK